MNNNEQKIDEIITIKNVELENEEKESSFSIGKIESSDEKIEKEQQKSKKSIKFGGWLPDMLDWFKRPELAQSPLSTSSYILNRYCWPKLHGRKVKAHIVQKLTFLRGWDNAGNWYKVLEKDDKILIPIANINPPEYIIGFKNIFFWFVDNRVLQFVQAILPVFKEEKVEIKCRNFGNNPQHIGSVENLLAIFAPKTNKLEICEAVYNNLAKSIQQFQSICLFKCNSENEVNSIVKWLIEPREDGKPKMLEIEFKFNSYADSLIDRIKEAFLNSIEPPVNFIIWMRSRTSLLYFDREEEIFKIENEKTREILKLYNKSYDYEKILIRHKKDGEKTPRDEWEEEFKRESKTTIWIML